MGGGSASNKKEKRPALQNLSVSASRVLSLVARLSICARATAQACLARTGFF